MLKFNFASRFIFAGIGFFIVLALPVLLGNESASRFYTVIMALNLSSGWFSLSFRQQLYVDIQKTDHGERQRPTFRKGVQAKAVALALLVVSTLLIPYAVPEIADMQGIFFFALLSAYMLSFSYVTFWYAGRLYLSYAIDATVSIVVFLTFIVIGDVDFTLAFSLVLLVAASFFAFAGFHQWLSTAQGPNTAMSQLLSQLIAIASFAEVIFFSGISAAEDIVIYRITLSFVAALSIIFSVIRQWEIFQNIIAPKRQRSQTVLCAAVAVMLAACLAYLLYPPLLFALLLFVVVAQLFAAPDQFLVIRDNRSHALVLGYVLALTLSFGGAFLFGVNDLYELLFFKIILIGTTALVPTCVVLIIGIREQ